MSCPLTRALRKAIVLCLTNRPCLGQLHGLANAKMFPYVHSTALTQSTAAANRPHFHNRVPPGGTQVTAGEAIELWTLSANQNQLRSSSPSVCKEQYRVVTVTGVVSSLTLLCEYFKEVTQRLLFMLEQVWTQFHSKTSIGSAERTAVNFYFRTKWNSGGYGGKISLTIKMPLKDCEQGCFLVFYFQFGVPTIYRTEQWMKMQSQKYLFRTFYWEVIKNFRVLFPPDHISIN